MSQVTINGTKGAWPQPTRFGVSESGEYVIFTWEGTRSEIQALIPGLRAFRAQYDYQQSYTGAKDRIEARFAAIPGSQETPLETWELTSGSIEKDLLNSNAADGLNSNEKSGLRSYMSDPEAEGALPAFVAGSIGDQFFQLIRKGVTSYRISAAVLKHTQTVSNAYAIQISQSNVGRIISTASMYSLELVPGNLLFSLPDDIDPNPNPALLHYGWYKNKPDVRRSAWNKTSLEQSWDYGLWPFTIYGSVL